MARNGDAAREALLDTAERLLAQHGIDAISNRRIADEAGAGNHSAIAYHFGTRDDLLAALLLRHADVIAPRRAELIAELGSEPGPHDLVRCRLIPMIEHFESLPTPSWRAQFLAQAESVPSAVAIARERVLQDGSTNEFQLLRHAASHVPDAVLGARITLVGSMVLSVCADYERRRNAGDQTGSWLDIGYFLIDAVAGMLTAPVTYATPLRS